MAKWLWKISVEIKKKWEEVTVYGLHLAHCMLGKAKAPSDHE